VASSVSAGGVREAADWPTVVVFRLHIRSPCGCSTGGVTNPSQLWKIQSRPCSTSAIQTLSPPHTSAGAVWGANLYATLSNSTN
jgi:hypothetical protein